MYRFILAKVWKTRVWKTNRVLLSNPTDDRATDNKATDNKVTDNKVTDGKATDGKETHSDGTHSDETHGDEIHGDEIHGEGTAQLEMMVLRVQSEVQSKGCNRRQEVQFRTSRAIQGDYFVREDCSKKKIVKSSVGRIFEKIFESLFERLKWSSYFSVDLFVR